MNFTHCTNALRWYLYTMMIQNKFESWISAVHLLLLIRTLISWRKLYNSWKPDAWENETFTTCLQMIQLQNSHCKESLLKWKQRSRKWTICSVEYTATVPYRDTQLCLKTAVLQLYKLHCELSKQLWDVTSLLRRLYVQLQKSTGLYY
jgi:hypothetical protein